MAKRAGAKNRAIVGVEVVWDDHFDVNQPSWVTKEDIEAMGVYEAVVTTRGWLVLETKDRLLVARDRGLDDEKFGSIMIIHKALVKKVRKLRK